LHSAVDVTRFTRIVQQVADFLGRAFSRVAAIAIGCVLMVIGIAMAATIVMLPVGVVLALLGVGILVSAIFAPNFGGNPDVKG